LLQILNNFKQSSTELPRYLANNSITALDTITVYSVLQAELCKHSQSFVSYEYL